MGPRRTLQLSLIAAAALAIVLALTGAVPASTSPSADTSVTLTP